MMTTNQKLEVDRTYASSRPAVHDVWTATARIVRTAARRLDSAGWVVELVVLGLAALLVGLGALWGLAVFSASVPPGLSHSTHLTQWKHEADVRPEGFGWLEME